MHRSQWTCRLGALALAACAAMPAAAQDATPAPQPAPPPTQRPTIVTLPGADRFELQPSDPNARPAPRQPPTQPAAPPPRPRAETPARAEPAPRGASPAVTPSPRTPAAAATPEAETTAPEPTPTPTPTATPPAPASLPAPAPVPVATAPATTATPAVAPEAATAIPAWLWALLGAAGLALLAWLLMRRRRPARRRGAPRREAVAVPPPAPVVPVRPAPAPRAAPLPIARAPVAAPQEEPIAYEFRPGALELNEGGAVLDYELFVVNKGDKPLEGVRIALAMMSASPRQDEVIERFHRAPPVLPTVESIQLEPGKVGRLPGQLALDSDRVHVVDVGGRPMFVPMVMVDVRFRAGLSIRGHGADFMLGTSGQGPGQAKGGRLGPVWLDRGRRRIEGLAATRYFRKPAVQAAE